MKRGGRTHARPRVVDGRPHARNESAVVDCFVRTLSGPRAAVIVVEDSSDGTPDDVAAAEKARGTSADAVVASHFAEGGRTEGSSRLRSGVSHGSTPLARVLFRPHLNGLSDPLSGPGETL